MKTYLRGEIGVPFVEKDFKIASRYDSWIQTVASQHYDSDVARAALDAAKDRVQFGNSVSEFSITGLTRTLEPARYIETLSRETQNKMLAINSFFIPGFTNFNILKLMTPEHRRKYFETYLIANLENLLPLFEQIDANDIRRDLDFIDDEVISGIFRQKYKSLENFEREEEGIFRKTKKLDDLTNELLEISGQDRRIRDENAEMFLEAKRIINQSVFGPLFK